MDYIEMEKAYEIARSRNITELSKAMKRSYWNATELAESAQDRILLAGTWWALYEQGEIVEE
jgi:hypothetical protein